MKYFYTLLVVIGCSTMVFSQTTEECFVLNKEIITFPQEFSKIQRAIKSTEYDSVTFKVFFWGFKLSNNTGNEAFTEENIENAVGWLNEIYNQANIFFELLGYDTVLSNRFYKLDSPAEFPSMLNAMREDNNVNPEAFNVYVSNEYSGFGGAAEAYYKTFIGIPAVQLVNSGTFEHEVGHCLNLLHTNNPATGLKCESAIRDPNNQYFNADISGDFVTDTAASYKFNLTDIDTENCLFIGNKVDCLGFNYNIPSSLLHNFMTISVSGCEKNQLTSGQFLRIRQAIEYDPFGLFKAATVE